MRRLAVLLAFVCALSVAGASVASAQSDGFKATTTDVGPVIGFGGLAGAGVGFGGRFEKGFKDLPDAHMGKLGIGVSFDYWTFNTSFFSSGFDYKVIPIAVTVNYHLGLDNKKIDPFFGAGFGYEHFSVSGPSCIFAGVDYCSNAGYSNGGYFVGHVGIRYYWQPKLALYADAGSGTGNVHVGIMFKLSD